MPNDLGEVGIEIWVQSGSIPTLLAKESQELLSKSKLCVEGVNIHLRGGRHER